MKIENDAHKCKEDGANFVQFFSHPFINSAPFFIKDRENAATHFPSDASRIQRVSQRCYMYPFGFTVVGDHKQRNTVSL